MRKLVEGGGQWSWRWRLAVAGEQPSEQAVDVGHPPRGFGYLVCLAATRGDIRDSGGVADTWVRDLTQNGDVGCNPSSHNPTPPEPLAGLAQPVLMPMKQLFARSASQDDTNKPPEETNHAPRTPTENWVEYYKMLRKCTLHNWQPNIHERGIQHAGKTYQDMALRMARGELYQDILVTQPGNVDVSYSLTLPRILFPRPPSTCLAYSGCIESSRAKKQTRQRSPRKGNMNG